MIDHIGLAVTDPAKSKAFYDTALAPLGYAMLMEVPKEFAGGKALFGYGVAPHCDFWVAEGAVDGRRNHVAFRAESRKQVDDFYAAAIAAGGKDNGAPGVRAHYHKDYYGAFVFDPDGHNIEVVCHAAD